MRVELQNIYQSAILAKANQRFTEWCAWMRGMAEETQNILQPMVEVAGTVERQLQGLLAHWKAGLTNRIHREAQQPLFSH
jgi:hypothetical protein